MKMMERSVSGNSQKFLPVKIIVARHEEGNMKLVPSHAAEGTTSSNDNYASLVGVGATHVFSRHLC